jgi:hypothetical protein
VSLDSVTGYEQVIFAQEDIVRTRVMIAGGLSCVGCNVTGQGASEINTSGIFTRVNISTRG